MKRFLLLLPLLVAVTPSATMAETWRTYHKREIKSGGMYDGYHVENQLDLESIIQVGKKAYATGRSKIVPGDHNIRTKDISATCGYNDKKITSSDVVTVTHRMVNSVEWWSDGDIREGYRYEGTWKTKAEYREKDKGFNRLWGWMCR